MDFKGLGFLRLQHVRVAWGPFTYEVYPSRALILSDKKLKFRDSELRVQGVSTLKP